MPAGEGITRGRDGGVAEGEDARIPDPRAVGADRDFQEPVDQPVRAPAHQQEGAESLADAPVNDRHDDEHRPRFAQIGHLREEIGQNTARPVPERLQPQKNVNIHISLSFPDTAEITE